jgi:hypothetical protein
LSASQAAEAPANAAYDYWLTLAAGGDGGGGTGITCFSNARLMMVLSYFCSDVFLRTKHGTINYVGKKCHKFVSSYYCNLYATFYLWLVV